MKLEIYHDVNVAEQFPPGTEVQLRFGVWDRPATGKSKRKRGYYLGGSMVVVGDLAEVVRAAKAILRHLNSGGE